MILNEECNQKFPRYRPRRRDNDSQRPDVQWRFRIASEAIRERPAFKKVSMKKKRSWVGGRERLFK